MIPKTIMASVAAGALLLGSTMAAAAPVTPAPASNLSVANSLRASSKTSNVNHQSGGFPFLIVFVVIAAGLGLYFAVKDDGDDKPVSA